MSAEREAVERLLKDQAHHDARQPDATLALFGRADLRLILTDYARLKAAKWDVKHVDTMNDAVLQGLAIESQAEEIERLNATIERLQSESAKDGEVLAGLDTLEGLAKAATPGPWRAKKWPVTDSGSYLETELSCINGLSAWFTLAHLAAPSAEEVGYSDGAIGSPEDNAAFIAAANPQAILKLIALARKATPPAGSTQIGEG